MPASPAALVFMSQVDSAAFHCASGLQFAKVGLRRAGQRLALARGWCRCLDSLFSVQKSSKVGSVVVGDLYRFFSCLQHAPDVPSLGTLRWLKTKTRAKCLSKQGSKIPIPWFPGCLYCVILCVWGCANWKLRMCLTIFSLSSPAILHDLNYLNAVTCFNHICFAMVHPEKVTSQTNN